MRIHAERSLPGGRLLRQFRTPRRGLRRRHLRRSGRRHGRRDAHFSLQLVQPHTPLIPYLQVGAGGVYTNIGERESRGLISLPVEFNLQATGGTRLMLNDRWSLVLEAGYRHISTAEIKKPNYGIDSIGGNVGFGFFF
ncbi:MAG: acyloxyacyl hydrolase [Chthoniobacterales bacterium]|nr:acyloxyacyl hydrolase [Chthoniobacterales bacterium]